MANELALQHDYGEDYGVGFEGQTNNEIQIPFLSLLQDLSPQVTEGGKRAGEYFNTVTEESLGTEILFVPCHREHAFVEWKSRSQGGGFVARHAPGSPIVEDAINASKEFGKLSTPAGNNLVESFYLYGIVAKDEDNQPAVVSFSSTKIKVFRKWNTTVNMFTVVDSSGSKRRPPRYAHLIKIGSLRVKNSKGSFFIPTIVPANTSIRESLLGSTDIRYQSAKALCQLVMTGKAKVADDTTDTDNEPEVF